MAKKVRPAKRHKARAGKEYKQPLRRVVALNRLKALTKKYQDEGLPLLEAHRRAVTEMRDNPPKEDWPGG